jgi:hypothetical protein
VLVVRNSNRTAAFKRANLQITTQPIGPFLNPSDSIEAQNLRFRGQMTRHCEPLALAKPVAALYNPHNIDHIPLAIHAVKFNTILSIIH